MILLIGVVIPAFLSLIFMHCIFWSRTKHWSRTWRNIFNWTTLIIATVVIFALMGVGALHSGIIGILFFILGGLWIEIFDIICMKKTKNAMDNVKPKGI